MADDKDKTKILAVWWCKKCNTHAHAPQGASDPRCANCGGKLVKPSEMNPKPGEY